MSVANQPGYSVEKLNFYLENPVDKCYDEVAVNDADSLKGDNPMRKSDFFIDALYERLSREDDDAQGQSNSIKTQKQLLEDYAKNHGFANTRHYADDGTSGTTFQRDAWQELIADVEAGKIRTIICKEPYVKQKLKNN